MKPGRSRTLVLASTGLLLLVAILAFPRLLAFVELGARELRYFWWIVLLAALGVWLAFFYRRGGE
jgi:hypothetical protein